MYTHIIRSGQIPCRAIKALAEGAAETVSCAIRRARPTCSIGGVSFISTNRTSCIENYHGLKLTVLDLALSDNNKLMRAGRKWREATINSGNGRQCFSSILDQ